MPNNIRFEIVNPSHNERVLIIPDVHGCADALERLLARVGLSQGDTIVFLGDMINKGTQSLRALRVIKNLMRFTRCVLLRGNHEQLLLHEDAKPNSHLGRMCRYLRSESLLGSDGKLLDEVRSMFWSTNMYCELKDGIAVHAGIDFSAPDPFSDYHSMLWKHSEQVPAFLKPFRIVCGHKPLRMRDIKTAQRSKNSVLCLDNGCYMGTSGELGRLICYDYTNDQILF